MKTSSTKTIKLGFSIIVKMLRKYRTELIILASLGLFSAVGNAITPYISGKILDSLINQTPNFYFLLSLWIGISLITFIISWRSSIRSEYLAAKASADYIIHAFSRIIEMPLSFHKKHKVGGVLHRIGRGSNSLEPIIGRVLINLTPEFLSILLAIAICSFVNIKLGSLLFVAMLVYLFILIKKTRPSVEISMKMHDAYQKAYGDASDAISNIQSVKQATSEKYEQKKLYKGFHLSAIKHRKDLLVIWNDLAFYQKVMVLFSQAIVFALSLIFVKNGEITIGEVIMFYTYSSMIFNPFFVLGNFWQTIQNGMTALVQSEDILKNPAEKYRPKDAYILSNLKGDVSFKNVSFHYNEDYEILKNIDIEIKQGEIVALVGESGVGKSTLIDLISGYNFATNGKLLIDGHNIRKIDLGFLRSNISVVPQEILLFNDTVKENISYGKPSTSQENLEKAARFACADEFIDNFPLKYDQIVGERGIKLSAGQKQRIAIARAVLKNPKILILDEPTSSLDAQSEKLIQESLEKLMKGRTTIIVAHRLSTVRKADKIIVLDKGKVAEQGRHEDLIKIENGVYKNLYDLQIGLK